MGLAIRMALYFASAFLAGQGVAVFDHQAGTLTFHLEEVAVFLAGLAAFVGTFAASRVAKANGGAT